MPSGAGTTVDDDGEFPELSILFGKTGAGRIGETLYYEVVEGEPLEPSSESPPAPPPDSIPASSPTPAPAPAPVPSPVSSLAVSVKKDRGAYILEEGDLPEVDKNLLHGRAFVIDNDAITETDSNNPRTYYIAYDQVQGLVVPARSVSIEAVGPNDLYYRWTDDGEHWSAWVTLYEGMTHEYEVDNKCRFAEVQVYAVSSGALLSLRATR